MEKFFIATESSKCFKDFKIYIENCNKHREFINKFFSEKGIDGNKYYVHGDGFVNKPFDKYSKDEIRLEVEPTENNLIKFKKMLCKVNGHELCGFRKNSAITKEFADRCIEEKIIINLYGPRINDYFKSLEYGMYGCRTQRLLKENCIYIKIESEYLKDGDIPKGFTEIKASEFYRVIEEIEKKQGQNGQ